MPICASCRQPIPPAGPSEDFCGEQCQRYWHSRRVNTDAGRREDDRPLPARHHRAASA